MLLWLDAQLPPGLARWLTATYGVTAQPVRELGLREASDQVIFAAARAAGAVVLTKDSDFVELVTRFGPPPQIVWLTVGNTSNAALQALCRHTWPRAAELLQTGEALVEISQRS